jgi:hypothetical protein
MALTVFTDFSPMKAYKQFANKKILIGTILGLGTVLSAIFIISSLVSTMAQQQFKDQRGETNVMKLNQHKTKSSINGSVSITNNTVNFIKEDTKISFVVALKQR